MKPEYVVQYRCPICEYETCVTNVCRRCPSIMYATGEQVPIEVKFTPFGPQVFRVKDRKNRKLYKNTTNYRKAFQWNELQFAGARLDGREIPDWAFKGD